MVRSGRCHKDQQLLNTVRSTFRGHTVDNITDHCSTRNATVNCEKWYVPIGSGWHEYIINQWSIISGDPIVKKNMKRHLNDVHSLQ